MTRSEHRYAHADTHDELSARRLLVAGDLTGARCLEVGAGAGWVARMLSAAVGPGGEVVATDRDPRFPIDLPPNVTVRRHDVETDPLEAGGFDLVHCRALLLHLADPESALRRMADAVCPGGWLVVEDADDGSFGARLPRLVDELGLEALGSEAVGFADSSNVAAWGRRPVAQYLG